MSGVGNSHLQITTSSPEAQLWFDEGLNLRHDFWDYESQRAFEQSVHLDPKCAMCEWGLYLALSFRGDDDGKARAALKQAHDLARHISPAEKLHIKASEQGEDSRNKKSRPGKPANAKQIATLHKLVALQPDDIQAKIFLAEALRDGFDDKSQPRPGSVESNAILQAVLASNPDDSAANHYWIHAMEPSLHPEAALESSRKLAALAPASGHMVHMPGHIFYRTGDYETARLSFEASMRVDQDYMRSQHVNVDDDWNYVHNLMYLIADLLEAGRIAEATEVSAKLNAARGESSSTLYPFNARDSITRLDPQLPVLLRSADYAAATTRLQQSHPAPELENLAALRTSLLDYTQGMAALQSGDLAAAAKFSGDLNARVKAFSAEQKKRSNMPNMPGMVPSKDAYSGPVHQYANIAALELEASLLMAQGKTADSGAAFVKAAAAEKDLGYHEPPLYVRPVQEAYGDALMRAKLYKEAAAAYQTALAERPNSGYPQFAIAQAEEAAGNAAAARTAYAAFLQDWSYADTDLPQLKTARQRMGPLEKPAGN